MTYKRSYFTEAATEGGSSAVRADESKSNDRRRRCATHFATTYGLTAAEAEIAAALADGARAPDIAEARGISLNTLRAQRRNAYAKLCVGDQIELVHALPRLWPEA